MLRIATLGVLTLAWAMAPLGNAAGQAVEYVTRDRQPIHAVRFNAKPIRITLTDRGQRSITVRSSATPTRVDGDRDQRRRPLVTVRFGSDPIRASVPETTRSRTVYGSSRKSAEPERTREPTAESSRETGKQEQSAEQRRQLLRVRAILRQSRGAGDA